MSDLVRKEIHGIFNTNNTALKQVKKYKRFLQEITKDSMDDSRIKYVRSELMEKIIKNCRGVKECKNDINREEKEKQRENFRILLGFTENDIFLIKEQSVLKSIMDTFEGENMQTQYSALGYKIDLYFHDYKLAIEIDEKGQKDRNINHEIERQKALKKKLNCKFIRINSDEENFNINKTNNEIFRHITESAKEITKKSTINSAKRLLKATSEFKNNKIISNFTKNIYQTTFAYIMEKIIYLKNT